MSSLFLLQGQCLDMYHSGFWSRKDQLLAGGFSWSAALVKPLLNLHCSYFFPLKQPSLLLVLSFKKTLQASNSTSASLFRNPCMYVCTHKDFSGIRNSPIFFFLFSQISIKTLHYYKLPHRQGEWHSSGNVVRGWSLF